ncbi:MAG TPA: type II toxin-antitoxin system VapC family toxin [Anaerolineales bacterium]|nr:type II toxin-antitoxin system VapC family toxin [Anaerolineales bacterium]
MNVVDSSGWLEYFAGGANASLFAPVVKESDTLVVPTVCMYEVFKRLLSRRGEESALQAMGIMSLGIIADLTREIAVQAAQISLEFKIAMAGSIILATTHAYDATLWTQDADFEGMGGVQYIENK